MRDYIAEITKGIFDLFQEAWEKGWLIYFIIIFVILVIFLFWQKVVFSPVDIFT